MSDSSKISFRLSPELQAALSARVRQGRRVSDILREALETYLGMRPPERLTLRPSTSASPFTLSAITSDDMSDLVSARLSDTLAAMSAMASDVSDIRHRLGELEARLDGLSDTGRRHQTPRRTSRPTPPPSTSAYDADAAFHRMKVLQQQGLTLAQIAERLTAEGLRTRHGKPWHKSSVAYVLKTHGR